MDQSEETAFDPVLIDCFRCCSKGACSEPQKNSSSPIGLNRIARVVGIRLSIQKLILEVSRMER